MAASCSITPPCGFFFGLGLVCFLSDVEPLDDHPALLGVDAQHLAGLAGLLAAHDLDLVALLDLHLAHLDSDSLAYGSYRTSGASDTIFMKFLSRSSRATGPKMRVPRGIVLVVDQHGGVLVERDVGAVLTAELLLRAHHHGPDHVALLDAAARRRRLHGADDDVAHRRRTAAASRRGSGYRGSRARPCCRLLSVSTQPGSCASSAGLLLCLLEDLEQAPPLRGAQRPRSPQHARGRRCRRRSCSSCACSLLERRTTLPYRSCFWTTSMRTTMVLSIASAHDDAPALLAARHTRRAARSALALALARRDLLRGLDGRGFRGLLGRGLARGRALLRGRLLGRRLTRRGLLRRGLAAVCLLRRRHQPSPPRRALVLPLGLHGEQAGDLAPRVTFNLCGLSSCPVACWKRRLNSSLRVSLRRTDRARRRRAPGPC